MYLYSASSDKIEYPADSAMKTSVQGMRLHPECSHCLSEASPNDRFQYPASHYQKVDKYLRYAYPLSRLFSYLLLYRVDRCIVTYVQNS